jgi:uncharacterized phage protein (TIGR01671 family)
MDAKQIKFRAWHKQDKQMYPITGMDFLRKKAEIQDGIVLRNVSFDDIRIYQFTGLKDQDGQEIWEGDILTDFEGEDWKVKYVEAGFAAICDDVDVIEPLENIAIYAGVISNECELSRKEA